MSSADDYLIVTESHDLGDGPIRSGTDAHPEDEGASLIALEKQGISILSEENTSESTIPKSNFSHELLSQGGIEIVSSEEDDGFAL